MPECVRPAWERARCPSPEPAPGPPLKATFSAPVVPVGSRLLWEQRRGRRLAEKSGGPGCTCPRVQDHKALQQLGRRGMKVGKTISMREEVGLGFLNVAAHQLPARG